MTAPMTMMGSEIRQVREELNLTQEQLAVELGVTANTLARWERNAVGVQHDKMLRLALQKIRELRRRKGGAS